MKGRKQTQVNKSALAIAFCLICHLSFCQGDERASPKTSNNIFLIGRDHPAIICGIVKNYEAKDSLSVVYTVNTVRSDFQLKKKMPIASDGSFRLILTEPFSYQQIFLELGNYIWIELIAHDSLFIEMDLVRLKRNQGKGSEDNIRLLGPDAGVNSYLAKYRSFGKEERERLISTPLMFTERKDEADILKKIQQHFSPIEHIDAEFIKQNPSSFSWIVESQTRYQRLSQIALNFSNKTMSDSLWSVFKKERIALISSDSRFLMGYVSHYLLLMPPSCLVPDYRILFHLPLPDSTKTDVALFGVE